MPLVRAHARSFHQLVAAVASAPLTSSAAFDRGLIDLAPDDISAKTPLSATMQVANEIEAKLPDKYSVSIDELSALRDLVWFRRSDSEQAESDRVARHPKTLRQYLQDLVLRAVSVQGGRILPHAAKRDEKLDFAGRNFQRVGRQSLVWLLRNIPADLVAAVAGGRLPIRHLTRATEHALKTHEFAEMHLHLGASMSFSQLWPMVLNVVGLSETHVDEFQTPHGIFRQGSGMATWVLIAAIGRRLLAEFLTYRAPGETFGSYRSRFLDDESLTGGERSLIECVLLALHDPHGKWIDYDADTFLRLQSLYRRLRRVSSTPLRCLNDVFQSDPIATYFPKQRRGDRNVDVRFLNAGLSYLHEIEDRLKATRQKSYWPESGSRASEPPILRLSNAPVHASLGADERSSIDVQFTLTFWQVQRIRCHFFQHLTQQHSVHGLVWFTRYYRRISPVKGGVFPDGLQLLAGAVNNGFRAGLRSFEVRTQPAKTWHGVLADVQEIADAARHLNKFATQGDEADDEFHSEYHLASDQFRPGKIQSPTVESLNFEVGLVFHFVKERERGVQDVLSPFGDRTHEHIRQSRREYRYSEYYRKHWKRADAVAKVLQEYPLTLQWIRALDVCNDEQAIPIWVFRLLYRPIIKAAHSASTYLRSMFDMDVPTVRPTAHVGEDFRHLLTGLRRIDEAIEALDICEGDRLGHALALGTDPVAWAAQVGQVSTDKLTRLFDLAWEWSLLDVVPVSVQATRTHRIEVEMHRLIGDIFGHWSTNGEYSQHKRESERESEPKRPSPIERGKITIDGGKITIPDIAQLRIDLRNDELIERTGYPNQDPTVTPGRSHYPTGLSAKVYVIRCDSVR